MQNIGSVDVEDSWDDVGYDVRSLGRGESIELRGFGTFKIKQYGTYTARNPRTQEKVPVNPKKLTVLTVGKGLKDAVNENRGKINFSGKE